MKKADALLYLNIEEGLDPEEAYENQLFSFKQFFLSNVPTTKTCSAKRKRLEKIHQAYIFLSGAEDIFDCKKPELISYNSNEVARAFRTYQENNNRIKLKISSSRNAKCLGDYAEFLIENLSLYAKHWELDLKGTDEHVLVTKEPDAVEMLKAINAFNDEGYKTFDEIEKLDAGNCVYRESIRLSLWLKMENNE